MTNQDIALIVIATAALTAAVALVAFHLYLRSYRRTLAQVRGQRNRWWREARNLRADRPAVHRTLAERAAQAIEHTVADDRYWPVAGYLPVFEGDNPVVAEYASTAAAIRKAGIH